MSSVEAVQGVSLQGRELRPELDLAVLQSYELARFYNIQELKMIEPIAVREEGLRRIEPAEPAPVAAAPWAPLPMPATEDPLVDARSDREDNKTSSVELPREPRNAAATAEACGASQESVSLGAENANACDAIDAPAPETLPYGDDAARIRQLVEWIVTGREVVPFAFHYRQPGDLVELQGGPARPIVSARQVAAVYRAY